MAERLKQIQVPKISRREAIRLGVYTAAGIGGAAILCGLARDPVANFWFEVSLMSGAEGEDEAVKGIKDKMGVKARGITKNHFQLTGKDAPGIARDFKNLYDDGGKTYWTVVDDLLTYKSEGEVRFLYRIATQLTSEGAPISYNRREVMRLLDKVRPSTALSLFRPGGEVYPRLAGLDVETAEGVFGEVVKLIGKNPAKEKMMAADRLVYVIAQIAALSGPLVCERRPDVCEAVSPTATKSPEASSSRQPVIFEKMPETNRPYYQLDYIAQIKDYRWKLITDIAKIAKMDSHLIMAAMIASSAGNPKLIMGSFEGGDPKNPSDPTENIAAFTTIYRYWNSRYAGNIPKIIAAMYSPDPDLVRYILAMYYDSNNDTNDAIFNEWLNKRGNQLIKETYREIPNLPRP